MRRRGSKGDEKRKRKKEKEEGREGGKEGGAVTTDNIIKSEPNNQPGIVAFMGVHQIF